MSELPVIPGGEAVDVIGDLIPAPVDAARDHAPARLAELEAKIARAVHRSRAEATLRAYRSDWEDFTTWCTTVGLTALPASPATVAAYVADLADPPDERPPPGGVHHQTATGGHQRGPQGGRRTEPGERPPRA
jgi:hypothetical protein